MKKIAIALTLAITTLGFSQEKVKLRLNYKKGDRYETKMKMNQDMGVMVMDMDLTITMKVNEVKEEGYDTENNFTYVSSVINQQGVEKVNYNSNMKEEELSAEAKEFREKTKSLLETTMFITVSKIGESKLVKTEPVVTSMDQVSNQMNTTVYPKEAVSVGSSWTSTQDSQGMKMNLTYTVKEITKEKVLATINGKMDILPDAKIIGDIEIDRATGVPVRTSININVSSMGMNLKNKTEATVRKL